MRGGVKIPAVRNPVNTQPETGGMISKIKSAFSRAAELEKGITSNPLPTYSNKPANVEVATDKSGKRDPNEFYRLGDTGSIRSGNATDVPKSATVVPKDQLPFKVGTPEKPPVANDTIPAFVRQNKSAPVLTDKPAEVAPVDKPAVFKTNPDRDAQQLIGGFVLLSS
jgi:hypothetical protein